jgi:hypothetical protein
MRQTRKALVDEGLLYLKFDAGNGEETAYQRHLDVAHHHHPQTGVPGRQDCEGAATATSHWWAAAWVAPSMPNTARKTGASFMAARYCIEDDWYRAF